MHLEHEWILYYDEGAPKGQENTPFESFVKVIGQFSTVQVSYFTNNAINFDNSGQYSGGYKCTIIYLNITGFLEVLEQH